MAREWDNLILLDSCRYDFFADVNTIEGDLNQVVSRGSHSWEFMQENFLRKEFHDTVYVTANPYSHRLDEDIFYTIEYVHDQWDEQIGTVRPEEVVNVALKAHDDYSNKRLIVHMMQPHYPYLGPTADRIREQVDIKGHVKSVGEEGEDGRTGTPWWTAVENGNISWDDSIQAYRETLEIALNHTEDLVTKLNGKSVVSADHGEVLGEQIAPLVRRRYGHPYGFHTEETCTVPWLELPANERREIVAEEPIGSEKVAAETVDERLEALGYKTR